jgi:hypothetical protein
MMGYLQANSRPDIAFAVSQCAWFAHRTKRSHEEALERIGQYLKGTMDQGLILRPQKFDGGEFITSIRWDSNSSNSGGVFAGGLSGWNCLINVL